MFQWGDKLEALYTVQEQMGFPPEALRSRPKLSLVEGWYYEQFCRLSRDRRYTEHGPLNLTTTDIHSYWSIFKLFDFESFYQSITTIDDLWMEEVAKKRKMAEQKNKPKPKGAPTPRRAK